MADKIGARKNGNFRAISTAPSINKTPIGPSTPPVPYPVFQDLSSSVGTAANVNFNGDPAYLLNQSTQPTCIGDAAGTALGVKSGTVSGEVKPTSASTTVNACGRPVVRELDTCTLNGGNCPGIYVTQPAPGGMIANGQPVSVDNPVKPETPNEAQAARQGKGFWHQVGGFFKGAYEGGKGMVVGLVQMAANPVATAEGLYDAGPSGIAKAFAQPYKEAWAAGEYGQAFGRGSVDVASLAAPGVGEAGKAGEAGEIGEFARAGELEVSVAKVEGAATKTEAAAVAKTDTELGQVEQVTRGQSEGASGVKIERFEQRPTWRQSEKDVGERLGTEYSEQKSFKDGDEVPYGTEGSTRPDWYKPGSSVEVKNYDIQTLEGQDRLVQNVTEQAIGRAQNLPEGTIQSLVIDTRGQEVSQDVLDSLTEKIADGSQGNISADNISFLR